MSGDIDVLTIANSRVYLLRSPDPIWGGENLRYPETWPLINETVLFISEIEQPSGKTYALKAAFKVPDCYGPALKSMEGLGLSLTGREDDHSTGVFEIEGEENISAALDKLACASHTVDPTEIGPVQRPVMTQDMFVTAAETLVTLSEQKHTLEIQTRRADASGESPKPGIA